MENLSTSELNKCLVHAFNSLSLSDKSFNAKAGNAKANEGQVFLGFMSPGEIISHEQAIPQHIDNIEAEFSLISKRDVKIDEIKGFEDLFDAFDLGVALELQKKKGTKHYSFQEVLKTNAGCRGAQVLIKRLDDYSNYPVLRFVNKKEILASNDASELKGSSPFIVGYEMLKKLNELSLTKVFPKNNILLTGAIVGAIPLDSIDRANFTTEVVFPSGEIESFKINFS